MSRKCIVYKFYKVSRMLYLKKVPIVPKFIQSFIRIMFGCTVPITAEIGLGTVFPHGGIGVVVHSRTKIGLNCTILQNVTIGGKKGSKEVAVIGNNVMIGAGAVIIGNIVIGDNVVIGANSVVNKDIPSNSVVVGVPAKIIRYLKNGESAI